MILVSGNLKIYLTEVNLKFLLFLFKEGVFMVENEEKNWWDEEVKPKVTTKEWEETVGDFHELIFKLVENSVNATYNHEDESVVKQIIKNHFLIVNKFAYKLTLCENWMNPEMIDSTCKDFFQTIDNAVLVNEHLDDNEKHMLKLKRKIFSNTAKLYVMQMMSQVEICH